MWINLDDFKDDPQQVPSTLKARYREAVIIVVKVEDHHSPYESGLRDYRNNLSPLPSYLRT